MRKLAPEIAQSLVLEPADYVPTWITSLEPLSQQLRKPLVERLAYAENFDQARVGALAISKLYLDGTKILTNILTEADGSRYRAIVELLKRDDRFALDLLREQLSAIRNGKEERPTDAAIQKEANIILAMLELGDATPASQVPRLNGDPRLRTQLIHRLNPDRIDVSSILQYLLQNDEDSSLHSLFRLALWRHLDKPLATNTRDQLSQGLEKTYRTNLDPETHSVSGLLLEKLGVEISNIDRQMAASSQSVPATQLGWFVNSIGQTMIVLDPRKLSIEGYTPKDTINYAFAIASTELPLEYLKKCLPTKELDKSIQIENERVPSPQLSVKRMTEFCNWLTRVEFGESECCYSTDASDPDYYKLVDGYLQKKGYRIAFDYEWLFACQGGTMTEQFFADPALLKYYGWHRFSGNQQNPHLMHPVGALLPNPYGLFDVYGNASELCSASGSENRFVDLGGSSLSELDKLRSSSKGKLMNSSYTQGYLGMRMVRTLVDMPN